MLLTVPLALAPVAVDVTSPIVATSMFKNGYAMVVRDIPISGSGNYRLISIPAASLGTLWFAGSEGVTIDSVKTVTATASGQVDVSSLADIIAANIGKQLVLGVRNGDKVTGDTITGKLLSASGDILVVQTSSKTIALNKSGISSVAGVSGELLYKLPTFSSRNTLEFAAKGKGHISMISLERGITWAPGYSIDITGKDKLSLVAKATVLDDDESMKGVSAKFVTGFPNVPFAAFPDPLTSGESIDQFLGVMESAVAPGGLGGGGLFRGRSMAKATAFGAQSVAADAIPGAGMPVSSVPGGQLEDLFFYTEPNLTIDKGQRSYFVMFRMDVPYRQIYTCDLPDPIQNNIEFRPSAEEDQVPDVWHTLSFKNTSGKPLTTGPAVTFKSGEIIGQDTMNYVSAGSEAELKVTKALDVKVAVTEEEVSRERGAIKNTSNNPVFDLVTLKGTVAVSNSKPEPVTMRIRHDYTGDLVSAEGDPIDKKTNKGLRETNSSGRLTWNKPVASGQTVTLTYTYKVYVRS